MNETSTNSVSVYGGANGGLKRFLTKIKFDKWKGWLYLSPCIVLLLKIGRAHV